MTSKQQTELIDRVEKLSSVDTFFTHEAKWEDSDELYYGDRSQYSGYYTKPVLESKYLSGSDLSGGTLSRSNIAVFVEMFEDNKDAWRLTYGSHGTQSLWIDPTKMTEQMVEVLEGLDQYPVIDEGEYSEKGMEERGEAWKNWVSYDFKSKIDSKFRGAFEKKYPDLDFDVILDRMTDDDGDFFELFNKAAEEANEDWNDSDEGQQIDVRRVVSGGSDVIKDAIDETHFELGNEQQSRR